MANLFRLSFFIICVVILQITSANPVDQNNTDVCSLPTEIGMCRAEIPAYSFDNKEQKCVKFTYGGCGGTANRFQTLEDCQLACEACSQPIVEGPCFALNKKYGFNVKEKNVKSSHMEDVRETRIISIL